jgi:hypothetical protein
MIRQESEYFCIADTRMAHVLSQAIAEAFDKALEPFGPLPWIGRSQSSGSADLMSIIQEACEHVAKQVREFGFYPDFLLVVEKDPECQDDTMIRFVATGNPKGNPANP